MSLGLVATGFGIARAASLGLVTVDLSWAYAISAIWSNLELYLGVGTANLALTRSVYGFIRHGKGDWGSSQSHSSPCPLEYIHRSAVHDGSTAKQTTRTCCRPSLPKSEDSDTPLGLGIQKRLELSVAEEQVVEEHGRYTADVV